MKSKFSRRVLFFGVLGSLAVEWACAPAPQLFNYENTNPPYGQYNRGSLFSSKPDQNPPPRPVTTRPIQVKSGPQIYQAPTQTQKRVEMGEASWSGHEQHGTYMANGEIYDMYQMVAAHRTLAFGSIVRVTNMWNGRSVTVQIKDRGPFISGRIIDVSLAAARKLDMVNAGVVPAQIELLRGEWPKEKSKPKSDFLEKAKEIYDGLVEKILNKISN
jgi:rare lipoprotein A (peptidoglycan hydrolase)